MKLEITIRSKSHNEAGLWVNADVATDSSSYSGPVLLDLPEDASDEAIKAALAAAYGLSQG